MDVQICDGLAIQFTVTSALITENTTPSQAALRSLTIWFPHACILTPNALGNRDHNRLRGPGDSHTCAER
ncbi:hypothetical protein ACIQFZ_16920 [Streptomyces sp. NPDC093064]|uniref:hypothetical protein n=1 Tax=Streptomyces sp. NPDC093064 TaxID=3366020 RepID=UPI0037F11C8F